MITVVQAMALFLVPLCLCMFLCRFLAIVNRKEQQARAKTTWPADESPE